MAEGSPDQAEGSPDQPEEDDGNETIFRNLYETQILPPWPDPEPETKTEGKPAPRSNDNTIPLTDENAAEFGDITHVGWKGRVNYALQEYEAIRKRSSACVNDTFRDTNHLLEVAISTIVLMASGSESIPIENYLYTELYLKNIKDENGDHPTNISNLLKHMRFLKKQYDIKWGEEIKVAPPKNLVVAKIVKKSKIPVRINRSMSTMSKPKLSQDENED